MHPEPFNLQLYSRIFSALLKVWHAQLHEQCLACVQTARPAGNRNTKSRAQETSPQPAFVRGQTRHFNRRHPRLRSEGVCSHRVSPVCTVAPSKNGFKPCLEELWNLRDLRLNFAPSVPAALSSSVWTANLFAPSKNGFKPQLAEPETHAQPLLAASHRGRVLEVQPAQYSLKSEPSVKSAGPLLSSIGGQAAG